MDNVRATVYGLSSTVCIAGVVARVESLRGRMGEFTQQVEGLSPEGDASQFESLLAEAFDG